MHQLIPCDCHTVTIREDGVPNTISLYRVTLAPRTSSLDETFGMASGTQVRHSDDADRIDVEDGQVYEQIDADAAATERPAEPEPNSTKESPLE